MADIEFKCPNCQNSIVADEKIVGMTANCPHCKMGLIFQSQSLAVIADDGLIDHSPASNVNDTAAGGTLLNCPHCSTPLETDESTLTTLKSEIDCPQCGKHFTVESSGLSSARPEPTARTDTSSEPKLSAEEVVPATNKDSNSKTALAVCIILIGASSIPIIYSFLSVPPKPVSSEVGTTTGAGSKVQTAVTEPQALTVATGAACQVEVSCFVRGSRNRIYAPNGWVQLLKSELSVDDIRRAVVSDQSYQRSLSLLNEMRNLNASAAQLGVQGDGTAAQEGMLFTSIGGAIGRINMSVVGESVLRSGKIIFVDVPAGDYIVYGAGRVGESSVGFFGSVHLDAGSTSNVSPDVYVDPSSPLAAGWRMFGSGAGITGTQEWRDNSVAADSEMDKKIMANTQARKKAERDLRQAGLDPNDLKGNMKILKQRVEQSGLKWPGDGNAP